jgi:GxxExxY protein
MPIKTVDIQPVTENRFHELDYEVMRCAFAAHNDLGRFYDEAIYRNELARCCSCAGFASVETEVSVHVTHGDFTKTYFIDLLINRSVIYELKTVDLFNGNHRRQLLHYLFLCDLFHGKLLNFRTPRVTHEFVSSSLCKTDRHQYNMDLTMWDAADEAGFRFRALVEELVEEWGLFLEASLYQEATVHFLGGEDQVTQFVDIQNDGCAVGRQKFSLLDEQTAFFITAVKHEAEYEKYLRNVVQHSRLRRIQWVNFNNHDIKFVTVV